MIDYSWTTYMSYQFLYYQLSEGPQSKHIFIRDQTCPIFPSPNRYPWHTSVFTFTLVRSYFHVYRHVPMLCTKGIPRCSQYDVTSQQGLLFHSQFQQYQKIRSGISLRISVDVLLECQNPIIAGSYPRYARIGLICQYHTNAPWVNHSL